MDLANRPNMRLLVMHYPPYCSKFNPIEHRLFSQLTRSWNGAPLMSVEDAAKRAALTTTKQSLKASIPAVNEPVSVKDFIAGHLGASRLRTETAALTAAASVYFRYM